MRTYLILKEKAAEFNADKEIQALLKAYKVKDKPLEKLLGTYSSASMKALKAQAFDLEALRKRGPGLEKLDQLSVEVLLGTRK
jgi:xylose isomerase